MYLTALSATACAILYWAGVPHWYAIEMVLVAFFFGLPLYVIWLVRFGLAAGRGAVDGRVGRWVLPWIMQFTISKPSMEAYARTVTSQTNWVVSNM
ncbi:hypothetical protein [Nonomuraea wenchangensis]|uniref:hypothetical protein n=1 Tax=Nonomuraea wenchangensis TaxID=568860 RepID=UPI0037A1A69C